jgi:hypothetical protein
MSEEIEVSETQEEELETRAKQRLLQPCPDAAQLHSWIRLFTGLSIPRHRICAGHAAPFEYVRRAYFEPARDLVVWAPRGGGKTRLAAVATLLDLLHKPGCSVRAIGGSMEQSLRIWDHLLPDLEKLPAGLIGKGKPPGRRRVRLKSGSNAAAIPQSERAVRGLRVQKLRCDEVEMFKPEIWEAAQLVTRSTSSKTGIVSGTIEAISTFHTRGGLMQQIIEHARKSKTKIIHWCLLEVLEKCPPERDCGTCPLWEECHGVAKTRCEGFVRIDDAIAMKHRVSLENWQTEMLCRRPSTKLSVFPNFDPTIHATENVNLSEEAEVSLAIDFGFHNPFVCLWIRDDGARCHVIDEYIQDHRAVADHVEQIKSRGYASVKRICCDPAGNGRNDQTAESNVQLLRRYGYRVHTRGSSIIEGLELIRTALRPAAGNPALFIHPKCKRLIKALESLSYPKEGGELPVKDGVHDHPIDALRYFYVNRGKGKGIGRAY